MATTLQIVNKVMNKLRLSEVSSLTGDDYTKTVVILLNETKREIEDAWDWTNLRDVVTVTTSNGVQQYALTGMGDRGRLVFDDWGNPRVWDDTNDSSLCFISHDEMYRLSNSSSTQTGQPSYFSIEGQDGSYDPYVKFWPIPGGTYSIKFSCYIPQADLDNTATVPEVQYWPLLLGTYSKAVWERGEDRGFAWEQAEADYRKALADAIAYDAMRTPGRLELKVD